jgi:hypothetical protein
MINFLFKKLTEHIIYIINNRPNKVKDIYKLLIMINPFMINCATNSNNKNIVIKERYFSIFYSLTSIISFSSKENKNNNECENIIIKYFIKDNYNLTDEEKNLFLIIISFFTVYGKNNQEKIMKLLTDLYEADEINYFLEVYFNILYQLEKIQNYNISLLFNLLNILINFFEKKYNKEREDLDEKFFTNYFRIYVVYIFNSIKNAYN